MCHMIISLDTLGATVTCVRKYTFESNYHLHLVDFAHRFIDLIDLIAVHSTW